MRRERSERRVEELQRIARPARLEKLGEGIAQIIIQKNLPKIREVPITNCLLTIAYFL